LLTPWSLYSNDVLAQCDGDLAVNSFYIVNCVNPLLLSVLFLWCERHDSTYWNWC